MVLGEILVQLALVLVVGLTGYFVLVRPQLKRMAEHRLFLSNLKVGDTVVTQAGLIGTIAALDDSVVSLAVNEAVTVRIVRRSINAVHES